MSEELCALHVMVTKKHLLPCIKIFSTFTTFENTYYLRNYVSEDWEQEARIALYQALRTYEKQRC